jgi:hypothetical protein
MVFKNTAGNTVLYFDTATGNLSISGTVFATAGSIGGFMINNSSLYNGDSILLDASGLIRIGSQSSPNFYVTNTATYIGNQVIIKPGTLPVTNLTPNLYYDNISGILYRTTWQGSSDGTTSNNTLSAVISIITPSGGATLSPGQIVTFSFRLSGGTPNYTLTMRLYFNGSLITTHGPNTVSGLTGTTTGSFGNSTGTGYVTLEVTDNESNTVTTTSNTVYVQAPPSSTFKVTLFNVFVNTGSSVTWSATVTGGSGSYTYQWYSQYGSGGAVLQGTTSTGSFNKSTPGVASGTTFWAVVIDNQTSQRVQSYTQTI